MSQRYEDRHPRITPLPDDDEDFDAKVVAVGFVVFVVLWAVFLTLRDASWGVFG